MDRNSIHRGIHRATHDVLSALAIICIVALGGGRGAHAADPTVPFDLSNCRTVDAAGVAAFDAQCFFDTLVQRYRGLTTYHDVARVTQITQRVGEKPQRVVTRLGCEIEDGHLSVRTPSSRIARGLGLGSVQPATPELEEALLAYNLWLAPHMGLKYTDEPESAIHKGLKVTKVTEKPIVDEKRMVHVEMQSELGDDASGAARVDLYVNLDSLLVERIERQERMPDGASSAMTMEITPIDVYTPDDADEPDEPAEPAEPVHVAPHAPDTPNTPDGPAPMTPRPEPLVPFGASAPR